MKITLTVFIVAGIIAAGLILANRDTKEGVIASRPEPVAPPAPAAAPMPEITRNPSPAVPAQHTGLVRSTVATNAPAPTDTAPAAQPLIINGYVVQDPVARVALSFVGSDPEADAYWIGAINNPDLPPEERKDLIEDLNEDGLIDTHLATPEDLPLIADRIWLIEQIAPQAMDQTDLDAFAEAYKDLVNLYNGLPAN